MVPQQTVSSGHQESCMTAVKSNAILLASHMPTEGSGERSSWMAYDHPCWHINSVPRAVLGEYSHDHDHHGRGFMRHGHNLPVLLMTGRSGLSSAPGSLNLAGTWVSHQHLQGCIVIGPGLMQGGTHSDCMCFLPLCSKHQIQMCS